MSRKILRYATHSETGPQRDGNEDSAAVESWVVPVQGSVEECLLAIIADGMGGHDAGEVASALAVHTVRQSVGRALNCTTALPELGRLLLEAVQDANAAVWRAAQNGQGRPNMGTTLTAVLVHGAAAHVVHIGDSRAYLMDRHGVRQLTRDQTVAQDYEDAAILTPVEARRSRLSSQLTQALGTAPDVHPEVLTVRLGSRADIVLTTDGAHGSLVLEDFLDAAARHTRPQLMARDLVDRARARDGSDNLSVVWVQRHAGGVPAIGGRRRPMAADLTPRGVLIPSLLALVAVAATTLVASMWSGPPTALGPATVTPTRDAGREMLFVAATLRDQGLTVQCRSERPVAFRVGKQAGAFAPNDDTPRALRVTGARTGPRGSTQILTVSELGPQEFVARLKLYARVPRGSPRVDMAGRGPWRLVKSGACDVYEASVKRWPVPRLSMRFSELGRAQLRLALVAEHDTAGRDAGQTQPQYRKPDPGHRDPPLRPAKRRVRNAPRHEDAVGRQPGSDQPPPDPPPATRPGATLQQRSPGTGTPGAGPSRSDPATPPTTPPATQDEPEKGSETNGPQDA